MIYIVRAFVFCYAILPKSFMTISLARKHFVLRIDTTLKYKGIKDGRQTKDKPWAYLGYTINPGAHFADIDYLNHDRN